MEAVVYNQKGKESGKVNLPEGYFGLPWNADLVHQVVTSMLSSRREGTAHTKDRGDVRGGGKKPWRQKGTGRARHGSSRSPIWRGGGVTFGPRNDKDYSRKVNVKMKKKALYTVLSQKMRDGELFFIDKLELSAPKTNEAKKVFTALSEIKGLSSIKKKARNAIIFASNSKDENVEKGFRNFQNVSTMETRNLNPIDLMNYRFIAIVSPEDYLKNLK